MDFARPSVCSTHCSPRTTKSPSRGWRYHRRRHHPQRPVAIRKCLVGRTLTGGWARRQIGQLVFPASVVLSRPHQDQPAEGKRVQRDMDLIRTILLEVEKLPAAGGRIIINDIDQQIANYHICLMAEKGLLVYWPIDINARDKPYSAVALKDTLKAKSPLKVVSLTWAGHEFLDASRNVDLWTKAKKKVLSETGALAFELLRDYLFNESRRLLGISP